MAPEPLRDVIDSLRARLQSELDAELGTIAASHEQALEEARREADAQAEQQWAGRLESVRADWTARLQSEVTAARTEVERRMVADSTRARVEAEQSAAESAATLRRETEQAFAVERARAQEEIDAERARAQRAQADASAALDAERERAQRALADARAALDAERQRTNEALDAARRATPSLDTTRLVAALQAIDDATSLTGVIRAVVSAAAAEASRAALFIVNGAQLDEWPATGVSPVSAGSMRVDGREAGFLADVLRRGEPLASGAGLPAPTFAALGPDRRAVAVPFMLGGQPVAVLYADEGTGDQPQAGWTDAVQILGRHGAAAIACMTARKTADALHRAGGPPAAQAAGATSSEEGEQGARRYARLLVSEIKLYNEAAVRLGRQMRDLAQRLRPEIDRARRLYDERVSPALAARNTYFQQELVQTLADGDPSLLG